MAFAINADVNQAPSITWNHLNINRTHLSAAFSSFGSLSVEKQTDGVQVSSVCAESLALSVKNMATGLGKDFDNAFSDLGGSVNFISVGRNAKEQTLVAKCNADSASVAYDTYIEADEGSESTFIFVFDGDGKDAVLGNRIKVNAKPNSFVHLVTVNLLGSNVIHFDSIGSIAGDSAKIEVTELQLGASKVYSGNFQSLEGYRSCFAGRYGYVVKEDHFLDINYVASHKGSETESLMGVDGVVMDKASKTWRGTIDFINGCSNSKGDEQEDVLLLSPNVVNKSLPVILCGEEDVDGRHGASIGKLGKDILFYMQSRGISKEEAERMMIQSKIISVCRFIPDSDLVDRVVKFIEAEDM